MVDIEKKFNEAVARHEELLLQNSEYQKLNAESSKIYKGLMDIMDEFEQKLLVSLIELREEQNGISDYIFFEQGIKAFEEE